MHIKGIVYSYDAKQGYELCGVTKFRKKVSAMEVLTLDDGTQHLICCMDTGVITVIKTVRDQIDVVCSETYNKLGMIYKIEKIP